MRLRVPVLFVLLAWTSPVLAWSDAGRCNIGAAFPPSGEIPANIPALVVPSYGSDPTLLSFVLVAEDGTETLVEATERSRPAPWATHSCPPRRSPSERTTASTSVPA